MFAMGEPAWVFPKTYVDCICEFPTVGSVKTEENVYSPAHFTSLFEYLMNVPNIAQRKKTKQNNSNKNTQTYISSPKACLLNRSHTTNVTFPFPILGLMCYNPFLFLYQLITLNSIRSLYISLCNCLFDASTIKK